MEEASDTPTVFTPSVHYAIAFIYFFLSFASFTLNSIVLLTFILDRSLLFPANLIIVSIAVSDWLMGVVPDIMGGVANLSQEWSFNANSCNFYAFFTCLLGLSNMLHHATFALDRYLVISRPMKANHSMRTVLVVIACLWAFSLIWSLFPLIGWSEFGPEAGSIACSIRWQSSSSNNMSYIICLFIFFYFVPLAIIVACYTFMFKSVSYMTKNAQKIWGVNAAATLETVQASWKMAKIGIIMVGGFFFAWTPYAIVSFYAAFGSSKALPTILEAIPALVAKTASLYNPIVYFFSYKSFRESLIKMWQRHRDRNVVQPFSRASTAGFVISSRISRTYNNSTSVEELPL